MYLPSTNYIFLTFCESKYLFFFFLIFTSPQTFIHNCPSVPICILTMLYYLCSDSTEIYKSVKLIFDHGEYWIIQRWQSSESVKDRKISSSRKGYKISPRFGHLHLNWKKWISWTLRLNNKVYQPLRKKDNNLKF